MTWDQPNVPSNVVTSSVEAIFKDKSTMEDDFINDEEDGLGEYNELEEFNEQDNDDDDDDDDDSGSDDDDSLQDR